VRSELGGLKYPKMKKWFAGIVGIYLWSGVCLNTVGQDLSSLIEEGPTVAAILSRVFGTCAPFSATVQLDVSKKGDPASSTASGSLECKEGKISWQTTLKNIRSAQLSEHAKSVVRQLNGDQIQLVTRPDQSAHYIVMPGAQACLEQELPVIKLSRSRASKERVIIDGHSCGKEQSAVILPDGGTNTLTVWRAKDLRDAPLQIELKETEQVFRLRLTDVRFRPVGAERFQVPASYAKYSSFEDLAQSVLLDKVKRSIGLQ
jgi:hypothetical protein